MKKFLVGLLTVALAASMLVGCGKKEEKTKTDNSLKDVQSKKELVLGLDSSFPPMGFTDKKEWCYIQQSQSKRNVMFRILHG